MNVIGVEIPIESFAGSLGISSLALTVIAVCFSFVLALGGGIAIYWYYILYSKKVIFFENIGGVGYKETFIDRARTIRVGDGGEELLYLLFKRKYISAYGRKMKKNTFWFAKGQDGYDYNILLGDLDSKMAVMDIEPIDRDMRMESVAIRKNVEHRMRKGSWGEKYGVIAFSFVVVMMLLVAVWFVASKLSETAGIINQGLDKTVQIQEENKKIIASLDNIVTGGSGIKPVPVS